LNQIEPKIALVFAGGGSLGAIQVGMLRVLVAAGVRPDFVIGTSVGALNAGYFAGAPNAEGVARLEEIWSVLRRSDVFPFTFASAFGLLRHSGYIVDPGRLRRIIENNLSYARLQDATMPIHIVATDVHGMATVLSKGSAIDAILASAAIPGVFPPVSVNGRMLMDGAIATNTPIRAAADLGASKIIVLPTGYACALKEPPRGAIARVLHAITLLITWQLIRDLEHLAHAIDVCIVPTLCPLAVSPFDFSVSRDLIERAAASTQKWVDHGGLLRRSLPRELQAHRH
jgi:NTE family protein